MITIEKAKELSEILKAYSEGKTIQRKGNTGWADLPGLLGEDIKQATVKVGGEYLDLRIKPQPKLVPFTFELIDPEVSLATKKVDLVFIPFFAVSINHLIKLIQSSLWSFALCRMPMCKSVKHATFLNKFAISLLKVFGKIYYICAELSTLI